MAYLLDTGILLRLVDKQDRRHAIVNTAVGLLGNRGDNLVITTQNMYNVVGKQVHDARFAAMMLVWQVENLLTLNEHDFARYEPEGIKILTPASILASRP
jgi:hypothetical protein